MRRILQLALLVFVVLTVIYALRPRQAPPADAVQAAAPPASAARKVLAYYFHTSYRCANCMKFENWTKEALEQRFPEPLKSGALEWIVLNVEEPQNEHFVDQYKLHTKSIVLSQQQGGKELRWKNLARIWDLLRDKEAYSRYISEEAAEYLKDEGRR